MAAADEILLHHTRSIAATYQSCTGTWYLYKYRTVPQVQVKTRY